MRSLRAALAVGRMEQLAWQPWRVAHSCPDCGNAPHTEETCHALLTASDAMGLLLLQTATRGSLHDLAPNDADAPQWHLCGMCRGSKECVSNSTAFPTGL